MNAFSAIKNYLLTKVSQTSHIIYMKSSGGNGIKATSNFGQLCKEGYNRNATAHNCINEISSAVASIPFVLNHRRGNTLTEIESHPILDLLAHPNPLQSGPEFIQACISYLEISGNMFIEAAGPDDGRGKPRELYSLRPDRVEIIPHPYELVGGYKYKVGQNEILFDTRQVRHIKLFNPVDDYRGLSPISVAALAINKMNSGDEWNANLLDNSAVPSGALVVKGRLTDDQFDRMKNQMKETIQGSRNAGEPLLLEEAEWKEMSISPKDMDWLEGNKISAIQIAQIYNVPGELVNLLPATFQNRKEARKALYTETALPLAEKLLGALNVWLVPRFGNNLELSYDKDKIEALSEDQDSLWKRSSEARFLTVNEKRRMVGYDDVPGGDVILENLNQMPLADIVSSADDLDETALGDDEEDEKSCGAHCVETKDLKIENGKAFTKSERARFQKQFLAIAKLRKQFEKKYQKQIAAFLKKEASQVAAAYKEDPVNGAIQAIEANEDFLFKLFEKLHLDVLKAFGKDTLEGLKSFGDIETKEEDTAKDLFDNLALQFAKKNAAKAVTNVTATTKNKIRKIIAEAVENGLGVNEVAITLRDSLKDSGLIRSRRIARTEIHDAQNEAQLESVKALGRDDMEKGWMWSGKSRTTHAAIDGVWVKLKEFFNVAGKEMERPGDSRGGAENVINCICVLVFRRKRIS